MQPRLRLFLMLAILVFIAHLIVSIYAANRLTTILDHNAPVEQRFAPSFAAALCALPLLHLTFINSIIIAVVLAFLLAYLRPRTAAAIIILVPLLLLGGMLGTAMFLENRVERGWADLSPHAIEPAPRGDLATSLGAESISPLTAYLAKEIARGDDRIDAPPQEVDWFLIAHRSEIDALRRHLPATRDPLELFRMQKILLVDALQTRAWDEVEAAMRIADSLLHEPRHDDVLYAMAASENQMGVIRKLQPPPNAALPSFDPHRQLIDAIAAQEARMRKLSAPWYALPYARLCLAESADSALRQAVAIDNLRGCSFDSPADIDFPPRVPFNPTGVLNGGLRFAIRANRLLLDREGTARVLAMKSGGQPSTAARCSDRQWLVEGNMLRLDPPLPAVAPFLPTHHEVSGVH